MALTQSTILKIQLKAEKMYKDSMLNTAYIPHSDTALAVLKNQNTIYTELKDPGKENTLHLMWMDPCGGLVQDCTPTCTITGAVPGTLGQDVVMDLCKEAVPFSIDEEDLRTNQYTVEDFAAQKLMLAKKSLDEWWSQQLLVKLKAFAGPNFFPGSYVQSDGTTYIPDAAYDITLVPYLIRLAIMNQMSDTYMIDNGELFNSITLAGLNAQNLNGQGNAAMAKQLMDKLYFDMWNFAKAGITEDTFIINRGAVVMQTKARFDRAAKYEDGTVAQWRWSEPSAILPGVSYDIYAQKTCVVPASSTQEHIVHNFKVKTRGGIWNNPLACSVTLNGVTGQGTGVISLTKGTDPTPGV